MNKKNNVQNDYVSQKSDFVETSAQTSDNDAMPRSRIKRKLENQSKRNLVLTGIGLIGILIILFMWGSNAIIQFSLLLEKAKSTNESTESTNKEPTYIAPPILDSLPTATNSASIDIRGEASVNKNEQVKLYVNNTLADVSDISEKGIFTFKGITLKEGENIIKAQIVLDKEKSEFSDIERILYLKEPPELTIDEPKDGDGYSGGNNRTILVKGKTGLGSRVTVNEFIAVTKNDGSFSYTYALKDGENIIKVTATDQAGNKTEKEVKVKYSP